MNQTAAEYRAELETALATYRERGWRFFPLKPRDKIPLASVLPEKPGGGGHTWEPFRERMATEEEVSAWLKKAPRMNVAITTGAGSGLVIIEVDSIEGMEAIEAAGGLPYTPTVRSRRGWHFYFQHPGFRVPNSAKKWDDLPEVDIRADGGYVAAPPSIHPSGVAYTWEVWPETPLAALPEWFLARLQEDEPRKDAPISVKTDQVKAGGGRGELPEAYTAAIAAALGVTGYNEDGWSVAIACPMVAHEHDAEAPAAAWHQDKHILKCFKCEGRGGRQVYLAHEVADRVGVDWKDYHSPWKQAPAPETIMEPPAWAEVSVAAGDGGSAAAAWAEPAAVLTGETVSPLVMAGNLCSRIAVSENGNRATLIQQAAGVIAQLPYVHRVEMRKNLKEATGWSARDIDQLLKEAKSDTEEEVEAGTGGGGKYWVQGHGIYRWAGEQLARVSTFEGRYTAENRVDHGDGWEAELIATLEIILSDGRRYTMQIPAEDTADPQKLYKSIRGVAGVLATVEAGESRHLGPALDYLSTDQVIERHSEIAHTGWYKTDGDWCFVTPGGVVGDLPPGIVVRLRDDGGRDRVDLDRYRVKDEGDEAFAQGMEGLWGMMGAFEPSVSFPAIAFAFLPPVSRWLGERSKFVLHLVGRTGTLKTTFAQALMSLYGDWCYARPTMMWESTPNSIEKGGFPLCHVLALVDDYKPEVIAAHALISFVQRYTAGTGRGRLDRASRMMPDRPFRAWMLSTGEDLPTSNPSVMARVISVRLKPRETGVVRNEGLARAYAGSGGLPTVMARFIRWLKQSDVTADIQRDVERFRQVVVMAIGDDVPNRDRIAENLALLMMSWQLLQDFLLDSKGATLGELEAMKGFGLEAGGGRGLGAVAQAVLSAATTAITEERPTAKFLEALAALRSKKLVHLAKRDEPVADVPMNLVGWYDQDGTVYLSSAAYADVERYLRMSGDTVGTSRNELYRLMVEEGLLTTTAKGSITRAVRCNGRVERVVLVRAGVIQLQEEAVADQGELGSAF